MKRKILSHYWRCDKAMLNLGDYVTEVLLEKFGFGIEYYPIVESEGRLAEFDHCFLAIGTLFERAWFRRVKLPKVIWGCGYGGDPRFRHSLLSDCTIHLVRGPITRDFLRLPAKTPIGDPALLMGRLCPLQRRPSAQVLYVAHFNSRDKISLVSLEGMGVDTFLDIACTRDTFWLRVQELIDADFVLTSSLHAAILAHSYERPWALLLPQGVDQNLPVKWHDWFASLGLEMHICRDVDEARKWWQTKGCKARIPSLDAIQASFPYS